MRKLILGIYILSGVVIAAPFRPENLKIPLEAPDSSRIELKEAFPNLSFAAPVLMAEIPDNSSRFLVLEQGGLIKVFPNLPSIGSATIFADLRGQISTGGEMGLLGLAFSPDFASTQEIFVSYTMRNPLRLRVSRIRVSENNSQLADMRTLETVIDIEKNIAATNHNGGMIAFGPDRKLYIATGDGGDGFDPRRNGQNLSVLLGKLLRIDPLARRPYQIPVDNPFVGARDVREEIWAYGLRNPWRFSFDRESGQLLLADVGQGEREEINIIHRGGNYGWSIFEGDLSLNNPNADNGAGMIFPLFQYNHSVGISVTGGYVYRGEKIPELKGAYIYGDYDSGAIWALNYADGEALSNYEIARVRNPSAFAESIDAELYVLSHSTGKIFQLRKREAGTQPAPMPRLISETGVFRDLISLTPAEGVEPYRVNSSLWSDGSSKKRWLGLPAGTAKITFSEKDYWNFPVGTLFVKHFELNTISNSKQRLETRLLFHHREGWRGYTYVWNDEQNDAELINEAQTRTYSVRDPLTQEVLTQNWYFPSRSDCLRCHNHSVGFVLGANSAQFNHDVNGENFLARMNRERLFNRDIGNISRLPKLADPYDDTLQLQDRARSYLAVNCSHCHNPAGSSPGLMDFRSKVSQSEMNVVGVAASLGGVQSRFRIQAGHPENSAVYERMLSLDPQLRMPKIATSQRDEKALKMIEEWIRTLR